MLTDWSFLLECNQIDPNNESNEGNTEVQTNPESVINDTDQNNPFYPVSVHFDSSSDSSESPIDRVNVLSELGFSIPSSPIGLYHNLLVPDNVNIVDHEHKEELRLPIDWNLIDSMVHENIPEFVDSISTYPYSMIFANCFQQELNSLYDIWFDENGTFDHDRLHEPKAEQAFERIEVLESVVEYLNQFIPAGH
ncbi:hypothetical protein BC833DRAFT_607360 [Globomyces pollinis-pini]|nr:hypothetical protein BC833DRAFT_607360 [Globomyces pollinis-pini]